MRILKEGEYSKSIIVKAFINEVKKEKCPELLDVISLQNIKNELNIKLNELHVKPLDYGDANYDEDTRNININSKSTSNLSNKTLLLNIIHELIHLLSHRINSNISSPRGLGFIKIHNIETGRGINEGITEYLAEKIMGIQHHDISYTIETSTCGILSNLIGLKPFIKDLIYGANEVEQEFKNQYGDKMLMLYKSASSLLDTITVSQKNLNTSDDILLSLDFLENIDNAKSSLDNVLDEMLSIALEKNTNFADFSNLLHEVDEYPENENFKLFNFKKDMIIENYDKEVNEFLKNVMNETDEVTITQINAQSKNIRKSILQNVKSFISKKFTKDKGDEK